LRVWQVSLVRKCWRLRSCVAGPLVTIIAVHCPVPQGTRVPLYRAVVPRPLSLRLSTQTNRDESTIPLLPCSTQRNHWAIGGCSGVAVVVPLLLARNCRKALFPTAPLCSPRKKKEKTIRTGTCWLLFNRKRAPRPSDPRRAASGLQDGTRDLECVWWSYQLTPVIAATELASRCYLLWRESLIAHTIG
jgi:hypothetical protein